MKNQIIIIAILLFVGTNLTFAQNMTVKDNNANVLMEVNDEGTVGSLKVDSIKVRSMLSDSMKARLITIPSCLVPPQVTTYKL